MKRLTLSVCVGVCLILPGCGSTEHEDVKEWMRDQAKEMKGKVPPLPEIKPFPVVSYEAVALMPPFSPAKILTTEGANDKTAPDRTRKPEPLEAFPLEDLKITGVLFDGKSYYALIQTPVPNKPKHVRIGEYIGQNFGKITAIDNIGITITEIVKDAGGAWGEREVTMRVPKEGGR